MIVLHTILQFEKSDNKAAIVGYTAAAAGLFFFTEWLIHLPGLNLILGFPIQLVGVLALPLLYVRYGIEGGNILDDVGDATVRVRLFCAVPFEPAGYTS